MFNSKIYKDYYPIKNIQDLKKISDKDILTLSRWVGTINREIKNLNFMTFEESLKKRCFYYYKILNTYTKPDYILASKILEKDFRDIDEEDISFINNVIYRHKYNWFLSAYTFPTTNDVFLSIEDNFQEEKEFLSTEEYELLLKEESKKCSRIYKQKYFY